MNKPPRAGKPRYLYAAEELPRVLSALVVVSFAAVTFAVPWAEAASWQWSSLPGRERIEVRFDKPAKGASASRTGTTQLTIQLDGPAAAFTGSGAGQLVRGVAAEDNTLRIALRDPAFGYVVSRPNNTTMRVDVFADALGARWKGPDTSRAEAPPASTAANATNGTSSTSPTSSISPTNATPPAPPAGGTNAAGVPAVGPVAATPPQNIPQTNAPTATAGASARGSLQSLADSTRNVPPGEFVPLGPARGPVTAAANGTGTAVGGTPAAGQNATAQNATSQNATSRNAAAQNATLPNAAAQNATARVDPRTVGQSTLSNGRNVMAAPTNATRTAAQAETTTVPDIPKDPEVPVPSTNDLTRMTGRIESLGVGEPRPENALGMLRQRIEPGQTVLGATPPPASSAANASARTTPATPAPAAMPAVTSAVTQAASPAAPANPVNPATPPNQTRGSMRQAMSNTPPPAAAVNATGSPANATAPGRPAAQTSLNATASATKPTANATTSAPLAQRADQTLPQGRSTPGNAMRGRMLRPGEAPEPPAAQASAPATPNTPQAQPAAQASATPNAPVQPQQTRQAPPQAAQGKQPASPITPVASTEAAKPADQSPAPQASQAQQASGSALRQKTGPNAQSAQETAPAGSSVVQRTRTTTPPAVVGGGANTAPEPAPAPETPVVETATDAETRQSLGRSGVLGKGGEAKPEDKTVIYVDEKGNVVDKPPDIPAMMKEVQQQLNNLQYQAAMDLLLPMKNMVLPPETREQVLYGISECLNNLYKEKPLEGFEPVTKATSEAMNFNLTSDRVPEALYRLGMLNLRVGNQQDAAGYFGAMRTRYPHSDNVPYGYFSLGQDQLKNKQYAEAVQSFQVVMTQYPESKAVRDSARGMAEALYRQGHYDRAQILVDFVDRRWPRIYLDDPTYLPMVGEIQTRMQNYDAALQTYWTSYNLTPDAPDNHKILLQIGAIYLQSGFTKGARYVFAELLRKYPQSESAPKALLLMGEQGFSKDNPSLDELFAVFAKPGDMPVEATYRRLMREYPDAPEALQAELRDAALSYWNGDTDEAMDKAQAFMTKHPETPESERAREIILRGFARELEMGKQEGNNERILSLWEKYPLVQSAYAEPDDDMRVAMARARLNRGDEAAGLADLATFLDKPQGKYSDYVYNLFLAKYLQDSNWNGILDLGEKVKDWKMPTDVRNQLDYSRAISAENLGMKTRALPIWDRLHNLPDGELPLYQKAYATYFMAREAENRRDLKDAYDLNLRTLDLFTQLEDEKSDKADPERIRESLAGLMDVTEVAGRFAEALDWTNRYAVFVPQESPDYAGLLFRQARLHRKMGDMARWRALLDTIVQREPESVFGRMAASELRTQEVSRNLSRFTAPPAAPAAPSGPAPQTGAQGAQPAPEAAQPAGAAQGGQAAAPNAQPAGQTQTPAAPQGQTPAAAGQ